MQTKTQLPPKTTVISGATSGIGLAAATALAGEGHSVIGLARSKEKAMASKNAVLEAYPEAHIDYLIGNLASQAEIVDLAQKILDFLSNNDLDSIDNLVNNAGAVTSWFTLTEDGFELQFAVNHIAPFLLTRLLLPALNKSPYGRIITTSSASHRGTRIHWKDVMFRKHYGVLKAYKQSKLANVLFTYEFNRRFIENSSVRAFAVDPGLVNTDIGAKGTNGLVTKFWNKRSRHGQPPQIAAETIVYLATRLKIPYENQWYWKNCHPVQPSRYAQLPDPARRLWELSERFCGEASS